MRRADIRDSARIADMAARQAAAVLRTEIARIRTKQLNANEEVTPKEWSAFLQMCKTLTGLVNALGEPVDDGKRAPRIVNPPRKLASLTLDQLKAMADTDE